MEKSMFGSMVKTYPSKRNRVSRSYRPSYLMVEDAFDKLIDEEKSKLTAVKENFGSTTFSKKAGNSNVQNKLSLQGYKRPTTLRNIQNINSSGRVSYLASKTNCRFTNSEYCNKNKENTHKFSSRLFVSDSDSSADQLVISSVYNNLTDLEDNSGNAVKWKQQKKKFRKPTKSSLHGLRKSKAKTKRLNQYRTKFLTKTTEIRPLLKAVSTPMRFSFNKNDPWDISAIKSPVSTSINYNMIGEEKSSFSYENNNGINAHYNTTPKLWKNSFLIHVGERMKLRDEFYKPDFSDKGQNSADSEWLHSLDCNNLNMENTKMNSFNPVIVSTPEFDRKSKVRNILPELRDKCENDIKTFFDSFKSKNVDTENLNKQSASKVDVSIESQRTEIEAQPEKENLLCHATEKSDSVFLQSEAVLLTSKNCYKHDSCDAAALNNEKKDSAVPEKNIQSDKAVDALKLECKSSLPSISGVITTDKSLKTSSILSYNNSSILVPNITEVSCLHDNGQSQHGTNSINSSSLSIYAVSSANSCSREIKEIEHSVPEIICNELFSTSNANSISENISINEEHLVSSIRNLSLDVKNYPYYRSVTVVSHEKLLDNDNLEERFKVTLSLNENNPSDTSICKEDSGISANSCVISSCFETGQSSWNNISHISESVQQFGMENKIPENPKFRSETFDITNISSDFSNSDEQFMTIKKVSEVMPAVSALSYCSPVSSGEFFGFDSKLKLTENTAGSYGSVITEIYEVLTGKDVSLLNSKSSQRFRSSEKFSIYPNVSIASHSISNVTCASTDSGDFIGFSYDVNKDNGSKEKSDFFAKIAGITNRGSETNNSWSVDSIISSQFNVNKKSDEQNANNSSNSSSNSLSDTVVCGIIENKTKELANFHRTNKVDPVTSSRSGIESGENGRGWSKKHKALDIFPFTHRDNFLRCQENVTTNRFGQFETLVEENSEETSEDCSVRLENTMSSADVFVSRYRNFTERRKKRCALPTLKEGKSEKDDDASCKQSSYFDDTANHIASRSTFHQSLFLVKGKKWRRSFITLKNIRDFGFNKELMDDGNKGRCWRQNIENLINKQNDVTIITQEIEECSTLRTDVEKASVSGLEEKDTITEKSICSERPRFSYCVSIHHPNESANDTFINDNSFTWFINESRKSFVENLDMPAGDCSRNYSLPFIDYSVPNSARDIVLHYCKQNQPLPFQECFTESILRNCKKIGEGVYGEVFMIKKRSRCSVIKIIPIEGDQLVNGERQKKFDEILSELVISLELSNLKNRSDFYTNCFAEVQRCYCVYGKYPESLIVLWKKYDLEKGSDNDSPKIFRDDQQYLILELNHGGEDLESFTFNNSQQALSVFNQVANALAVAEQVFMFEHRDLHWGNVLISRCRNKETTFVLKDEKRTVKLYGVKVTIIDYTLSRISINNRTFYNNIGQDPELFTAEGDFQFEVYRLMKNEVKNIWDRFVPKTNIMWLYYLIDKMINEVRYRRDFTKIHMQHLEKLQELHGSIMDYESSCDFVKNRFIL